MSTEGAPAPSTGEGVVIEVPRGAVFYRTGAVRQANTSRYITIPGVWGIKRGEDIVALVCNLVTKEAVVVEARILAFRTSKRFIIPCTHRWIAEPGAAVTIALMRRGEFEARIAEEGADCVEGLVPGAVLRGMTMTRVAGSGEQMGLRFTNRVGEFIVDAIEKVKEAVVEDDRVDAVIDSIRGVAGTGHPGDGRIFVIPVEMSVRIRADDRIPCQSRNDLDEGTVI